MSIKMNWKLFVIVSILCAPSQAPARSKGETITCLFPKNGRVVIDTREPGSSIMHKGQRHPAESGSYFYQASDDSGIVLFFSGAKMQRWNFGDGNDSALCKKVANR